MCERERESVCDKERNDKRQTSADGMECNMARSSERLSPPSLPSIRELTDSSKEATTTANERKNEPKINDAGRLTTAWVRDLDVPATAGRRDGVRGLLGYGSLRVRVSG